MLFKNFKIQSLTLIMVAFVLGFSEFIIVGILNDLAKQFSVSVANVGLLVTMFALIYAISTPFITLYIGRFNLFKVMLSLLAIFVFGNLLTALASNYFILILSRIITALVSGVIISVALTFATFIAPLAKRAWLVSWIFSGFSIASVFGVPLGTWISTHFGWRQAFYLITMLSTLTWLLFMLALPKNVKQAKVGSLKTQLVLLTDKRIWLGMLLPLFNLGGVYAFYTYLRPSLSQSLHFPTSWLTALLFIYGLMSLFSNQFSGVLAQNSGLNKMPLVFLAQALLLGFLPIFFMNQWLGLGVIMLIGFSMYLLNSPLQLHFLQVAEQDYPQALVLASSLNSIFANFGIALGSATGSFVVGNFGLKPLGPSGAVYSILALLVVMNLNKVNQKTIENNKNY